MCTSNFQGYFNINSLIIPSESRNFLIFLQNQLKSLKNLIKFVLLNYMHT